MDEQQSPRISEVPERWPTRSTVLGAIALGLALIAYVLRYLLLPFVIAAALGFVLDPVVQWLQARLGGRRWIGASIVFVLLLLIFAATCYWVGQTIADQAAQFASEGPKLIHDLVQQVVGSRGVSLFGTTYTADSLTKEIQQAAAGLVSTSGYIRAGEIGIGVLLGVFLSLVLTIYFLISGPKIAEGLIRLVPPERRGSTRMMVSAVVPVLRRYFAGICVVVAFTAAAAYVGFGLIFALPHALLLSIAVGVLEVVPALGPFTSMILVLFSAVQEHSFGVAALLMAYAVMLRLVIDDAVGPLVLGRSAQLHPVAVIFAFVVGAGLFGVTGLLLAVPAAATLAVVLERYYREPLRGPASRS